MESKSKKDYMIKLLITIGAYIVCYAVTNVNILPVANQATLDLKAMFTNLVETSYKLYSNLVTKLIITIIISVVANRLVKNNWEER